MSLDKKIENILRPAREMLEIESREWTLIGTTEAIKQAFIAEGWSTPVNKDDLINFGTDENPVMIHKNSLPFSPFEGGGYIDTPKDLRMTGSEWLARSTKELSDLERPSVDTFKVVDVKGALRRAAGVDE